MSVSSIIFDRHRTMAIEWDFYRSAKEIVAALNQLHDHGKIISSTKTPTTSSRTDQMLSKLTSTTARWTAATTIELTHWVIENAPHHHQCVGSGNGDGVVYLCHPPVLIHSRNNSQEFHYPHGSHGSHGTKHEMERLEIEETEQAAEELNIEIDESVVFSKNINNNSHGKKRGSHGYNKDFGRYESNIDDDDVEITEWSFSIVFHELWRVPTLYFQCCHIDGTPLLRQEVLKILFNISSTLTSSGSLEHDSLTNKIDDPGALGGDAAEIMMTEEQTWEFVSQEEHPMTGMPCYFLHPCQTAVRMELLLHSHQQQGHSNHENRQQKYNWKRGNHYDHKAFTVNPRECPLLSWMSMILPVVGCKISSDSFCQVIETKRKLTNIE